jgi:hypothetical protein
MFGEKVKITDSGGRDFYINISTPSILRLGFELMRNGNSRTWRPHFWGGDFKVIDLDFIRYNHGEVWYRRSGTDIGPGFVEGDVRHLDIFLFKGGEEGEDDWGIALRSFFALNGTTSSGGGGYLDQPWVQQSQPGEISWDVRSRYRDA